ncbi:MAG: histidine phosphatase family protein [Stellaceae bacterium]
MFHWLRHGEHVLRGRVLAGRTPGVGLSEKGRAEVVAIADRLADEKIAALYSSPLQRARETAEILSTRLGLPIQYRDDLLELDFGAWTGLTYDAVRSDERWQLWSTCRSIACVPGGESMRQVQERAVRALFDLREVHGDGEVLIVSHGDVIRAVLLFALGMPLDFYSRIEVGLASLNTIQIDNTGVRVLAVNERPHLPRHPSIATGSPAPTRRQ